MLDRLQEYEKDKMMEFHQIILDDTGIPDIVSQMRKLRYDIDKLYNINYKVPKI